MVVSEKKFRQVALAEPTAHWELHGGELRQKPDMTMEHNRAMGRLHISLGQQLDETRFDVHSNAGHVRISPENYFIPDVCVIPIELEVALRGTRELEWYSAPLPLVVEIWSASTGDYDINVKLPQYQRLGDLEIWRLHPYEHTLTRWQRQPDGSHAESTVTGGRVEPIGLSGVTIDLDWLFA